MIFFTWQPCKAKLIQFHEYENIIHPNMQHTSMSSATNISHLDISVSFDDTNIHTDVHTKSTDRHGYLPYGNFYAIHIDMSTEYSQLIGYKRFCSHKSTFQQKTSNLFQHFLTQRYLFKLFYYFRKVCLVVRNNILKHEH